VDRPIADIADRAESLLADPVAAAGFSLWLCEWLGGSSPILRVYVERKDSRATSLDDCVLVHEAITDLLDAHEFYAYPYTLEVSSPGLERPLARHEHFAAFIGQVVRIRTAAPISGRRNWKGVLLGMDGDLLRVLDSRVESIIPLGAVDRAHLVYEEKPAEKPKGPPKKRAAKAVAAGS
jgi:ribosome maturation factor RimP